MSKIIKFEYIIDGICEWIDEIFVKLIKLLINSFMIIPIVLFFIGAVYIFEKIRFNKKIEKYSAEEDSEENVEEYIDKNINHLYKNIHLIIEIIISNTCILLVIYTYNLLLGYEPLNHYSNFIMIFLIIIATIINNLIDEKFGQDILSKNDKSGIRLLSSCCIILLYLFIKINYKISEFDELFIFYIGLVLGRFFYFDTKKEDFLFLIKILKQYFIIFIMTLLLIVIVIKVEIYFELIIIENVFIFLLLVHFLILISIYLIYNIYMISIYLIY